MKPWTDLVTATVNTKLNTLIGARRPAFEGPVRCTVQFVYADLKSDPTRYWKSTVPDGDKLERAVWDALTNAQVWEDDARVVDWSGQKIHMNALPLSQEGVYITVSQATPTLF
jgi:crossover junction endodeoxyribonuclease RusA